MSTWLVRLISNLTDFQGVTGKYEKYLQGETKKNSGHEQDMFFICLNSAPFCLCRHSFDINCTGYLS